MTASLWSRLLDMIAPRYCAVCGNRLSMEEDGFCLACDLGLPRTDHKASAYDNEMARLLWGIIPVERAVAFTYYRKHSESVRMVHKLKYYDRPDMGECMGRKMAQELMPEGFFEDIDVIVPVPLNKRRMRWRGYNQSACIAKGISSVTQLPVAEKALSRVKFQESQTRKMLIERRENVEKAFSLVDAESIAGRHVLIVDDVLTSGSTACACGKELLKAGDVKLSVLTWGFAKS